MKRNHALYAFVALSILAVVLSACSPQLITPAQQTVVAATGMAAANGLLTSVNSTLTPHMSTPVPTPQAFNASPEVTSPAVTSGVPVTGATVPAVTMTSTASTGAASSGTNGSSTGIPNTGSAAPASQGSQAGCTTPLNVGAAGPIATLWIKNDTGAPIDFTMGIAGVNSFGQCGFLTFGPIKPDQSLRVGVPVTQTVLGDSCYWAYAVIDNSGSQSIVTGQSDGYCITTPQRWAINVHSDRIRLVGS